MEPTNQRRHHHGRRGRGDVVGVQDANREKDIHLLLTQEVVVGVVIAVIVIRVGKSFSSEENKNEPSFVEVAPVSKQFFFLLDYMTD